MHPPKEWQWWFGKYLLAIHSRRNTMVRCKVSICLWWFSPCKQGPETPRDTIEVHSWATRWMASVATHLPGTGRLGLLKCSNSCWNMLDHDMVQQFSRPSFHSNTLSETRAVPSSPWSKMYNMLATSSLSPVILSGDTRVQNNQSPFVAGLWRRAQAKGNYNSGFLGDLCSDGMKHDEIHLEIHLEIHGLWWTCEAASLFSCSGCLSDSQGSDRFSARVLSQWKPRTGCSTIGLLLW